MTDHILTNFSSLATTPLRVDALTILEEGLKAVKTDAAVKRVLKRSGNHLTIDTHTFDLDQYDHLYVIGFGKAAVDAGLALQDILGDRITGGIILDIRTVAFDRMKSIKGTHPFPTPLNVKAAEDIARLLNKTTERDLIIVVVSGGGSALLCLPYEIGCEEITRITKQLMHQGATIHEMNTVRKHLSKIQGGHFAQMAYPTPILGLIFSDVPGDDLSMVASGPTMLDTTTMHDAQKIMDKYALDTSGISLNETPKDPLLFTPITNVLVVSNTQAVAAMQHAAETLGYAAHTYSTTLGGEAREVGALLAKLPQPDHALLAAGETTVTITHEGKGGRNLEVALGALSYIDPDTIVVSCASDGIDNVPVAGAFADYPLKQKAASLGLDPQEYLSKNQSLAFFETLQTYLDTGPTGINISDLFIALRRSPRE